ncbi:unnamed protein product [Lactuca saligna]|uniref:F-box domain-containing protein n=1 Tax=Lactuca saligna TaxID=75948 RepID=A0AA35YAJ4_LACSI|nr:unnamed protein product [Lactuca saligna]
MNEAASISVLPEGCLSEILSLTSPRDVCRAATISKGFNTAADSDPVWERFLPPDYREIIGRAVSPVVVFGSKKQLYFSLSDSHIILDHAYLSFHLDKESGKKCYMLGAKELSIAWQDEPRYWEWEHITESKFPEVCILREGYSLGIQGKIAAEMLSQKSTYVVYLVFQTTQDTRGLAAPSKTKVSYGGTEMETENVYLRRPQFQQENYVFPCLRNDGWMEIKLGEFECNEGDDGEVEMAFEEVTQRNWKSGLIVEGFELRPK